MTFRANDAALASFLSAKTAEAADRVADAILDASKPHVPVDTGRLLSTGRVRDAGSSPLRAEREVVYGGQDGVDYPVYVEVGTRNAPAQPYLTPALDEVAARMRGGTP